MELYKNDKEIRYNKKIIFGKEQVNKIIYNKPFSKIEKESHIKVYSFEIEKEMKSFCLGTEEALGWNESYILDQKEKV